MLLDREREPGPAAVAERLVVGEREHVIPAPGPQLEQGLLQQRQRAGLLRRIVDQARHQLGLEVHPEVARRALDDHAQLGAARRAEIDPRELAVAVGPQRAGEERGVEVGAQREHQGHARVGAQRAQRGEPPALGVVARREQLLELIDDQEQRSGGLLARQQRRHGRGIAGVAKPAAGATTATSALPTPPPATIAVS